MSANAVITSMFFISGAAGLMFEMAWFYRSGLALGSSVWAASITVSSFMSGLALGSVFVRRCRIRHPLRAYALAEITLAITGVLVVYALSERAPFALFARVNSDRLWAANVLRVTIAFVLLLVPASAMGTTLPLLVGELSRRKQPFGAALGRMYGWNTLGAVIGVLLAEVVLVRGVGVAGTGWLAAAFDMTAAVAALALVRLSRVDAGEVAAATPVRPPIHSDRALLVAAALCGVLLVGLEVVWFRFLSMFVLSTTQAMSVMLAVVLGGIGIGGLVASRWFVPNSGRRADVATMAFLAGCAVAISYRLFQTLTTGAQVGSWYQIAWFAAVLTLPTSLVSGVLFTVIG